MEKVKLRKINFSSEMMEKLGGSVFGSLMETVGLDTKSLPAEIDVWVDPDKVVACTEVIDMKKEGYPPAFKIFFSAQENDSWDIRGECFDEFMKYYNYKVRKNPLNE